jgi:hypothetical protein
MLRLIIGVFFVLHGLVHLLYFGQSQRLFELQAGLTWPDSSWAFSRLLGNEATRLLASIACALAAVGLAAAGIGLLLENAWWRTVVLGAATFSSAIFALFWNGKTQRLPDQGWIGVLINLAILIGLLVLRWPSFSF